MLKDGKNYKIAILEDDGTYCCDVLSNTSKAIDEIEHEINLDYVEATFNGVLSSEKGEYEFEYSTDFDYWYSINTIRSKEVDEERILYEILYYNLFFFLKM